MIPIVIEDTNRNEYFESLTEFQENRTADKMVRLFEKEQKFFIKKPDILCKEWPPHRYI